MSEKYNPSAVGVKGSIFGLPYSVEASDLVFVPVHLDVTASYGDGTASAPEMILEESSQLDLSLVSLRNPWEVKMAYDKNAVVSAADNEKYRAIAKSLIERAEKGEDISKDDALNKINVFCEKVKNDVRQRAITYLEEGKIVGVIGGDHSSPLGLIEALAEKQEFGILQVDAHMDLRKSYEGFTYSHASIMYNALQLEGVQSLTQIGIRDFCQEEEEFVKEHPKMVIPFYQDEIYWDYMNGKRWIDISDEILSTLPENIYISFDVDGLEPSLCPNTGTPVAGGLSFNQVNFLIDRLTRKGKKIIGFDVCETGNDAWDANVAARILYRLAAYSGVTNQLIQFR